MECTWKCSYKTKKEIIMEFWNMFNHNRFLKFRVFWPGYETDIIGILMKRAWLNDDDDDENDDEDSCGVTGNVKSVDRNDSGSGLLSMSGGRSFHSLAVLGKKEYLWALILEKGIESLWHIEGFIYVGGKVDADMAFVNFVKHNKCCYVPARF